MLLNFFLEIDEEFPEKDFQERVSVIEEEKLLEILKICCFEIVRHFMARTY